LKAKRFTQNAENLPTCVVVNEISMLPTLTTSQGFKKKMAWKFWSSKFSTLITYVPIFKAS
jgi:hypothetical protein